MKKSNRVNFYKTWIQVRFLWEPIVKDGAYE